MKRKIGFKSGKIKDGQVSIGMRLVSNNTNGDIFIEMDILKLRVRIGVFGKYIKAGDK